MTTSRLFLPELAVAVALAVPLAFGMRDFLTVMPLGRWLETVSLIAVAVTVLITVSSRAVRGGRDEVRRG